MSIPQTRFPEFQTFLQRCRRRFLLHTALRGMTGVLLVALTVTLCCLVLDFISPLSGQVRLMLLLMSAGAAIVAGWRLVVGPLRSGISDAELGAAADLACPGFQEAVATVVSVDAPEAGENEAGSQRMRARIRQQIGEMLQTAATTSIMDHRTTLRRCAAVVVLLGVAMIPLMMWRSGSVLLLQRFLTPLTSRATATNLFFTIEAPGRVAARGSDVEFRATPRWRDGRTGPPPSDTRVVLTAAAGQTDSLPMKYDGATGSFVATLRGISDSINWQVEAGRAATAEQTLLVVDGPQAIDGQLTVTPPDYTGFAPTIWPGAEGRMEVFAGSDAELQLSFNKPVERAELVWLDEPETDPRDAADDAAAAAESVAPATLPLALAEDRLTASLTFTPRRGGFFQLRLQDEYQLMPADTTTRQIILIPDQPPELTVRGLRSGEELRPDDIIPLDVTAFDDVGIGDLELHLTTPDGHTEIFAAPADQRGRPDVLHEFRVDVTDYNLQDDQQLQLRVRATDQRPPVPHEVWSDELVLTIDSEAAAPGANALSEESRQLIQQLESARRELREDARSLRELRNTSAEEWESRGRGELTHLSERQQLLGGQLQELAEQADRHPLMKSPAQELQQLGSSLRSDTGQQLRQASQQDSQTADEHLQQAESQLIEARNQLGRVIRQLEQAAELEQDLAELNRLALQAEQLAADAEDLQRRQDLATPDAANSGEQTEREAALEAESEQIEETRRQLSSELTDLLNEQRELQAAAQQAIRQRQTAIADQAAELAERQQQLSTLMEYEDAADPGATTAAQQDIARQSEPLRNELSEIGRQVELPGVGLQDQSSSVEAARQSAETAAQQAADAGQASADGDRTEAAQAGRQAAAALRRVAQLAQNSDQPSDKPTMVPPEAGRSVTRALQHLTGTAQSSQSAADNDRTADDSSADAGESNAQSTPPENGSPQESPSPGDSTADRSEGTDAGADAESGLSDGEGTAAEPGEAGSEELQPKPGREQQLADAAEALSAAAGASLPGSILDQMELLPLPGDMAGSGPSGGDADGRHRSSVTPPWNETQRDWARLNDELSHDVLGGRQEGIDSRYASLIRAYFRQLARSSSSATTEEP